MLSSCDDVLMRNDKCLSGSCLPTGEGAKSAVYDMLQGVLKQKHTGSGVLYPSSARTVTRLPEPNSVPGG